jgi:hypothetical protein
VYRFKHKDLFWKNNVTFFNEQHLFKMGIDWNETIGSIETAAAFCF